MNGGISAATFGSNPPTTAAGGYQQASAGGYNFSNGGNTAPDQSGKIAANPAPTGTTLALLQAPLLGVSSGQYNNSYGDAQGGQSTITFDANTANQGATITIVSNPAPSSGIPAGNIADSMISINIPSLGINQTFDTSKETFSGSNQVPITSGPSAGKYLSVNLGSFGWLGFGSWVVVDKANPSATVSAVNTTANYSQFLFGYQTPVSAMPTTGSATYGSGNQQGGEFYNHNGPTGLVIGDVSITANFATSGITGSLTNTSLVYPTGYDSSGTQTQAKVPWNNVAFNGSIAGNAISGTASVTSNPGGNTSIGSNATGPIRGGFFGPSADQIGLMWSLNDGNSAAIGQIITTTKH